MVERKIDPEKTYFSYGEVVKVKSSGTLLIMVHTRYTDFGPAVGAPFWFEDGKLRMFLGGTLPDDTEKCQDPEYKNKKFTLEEVKEAYLGYYESRGWDTAEIEKILTRYYEESK